MERLKALLPMVLRRWAVTERVEGGERGRQSGGDQKGEVVNGPKRIKKNFIADAEKKNKNQLLPSQQICPSQICFLLLLFFLLVSFHRSNFLLLFLYKKRKSKSQTTRIHSLQFCLQSEGE